VPLLLVQDRALIASKLPLLLTLVGLITFPGFSLVSVPRILESWAQGDPLRFQGPLGQP
jgi:hypothetical protein